MVDVQPNGAHEALRVAFDPNRCTFNEMILFEDLTGFPIADLNTENAKRGRVLRAIVYIVMRRTNHDLTVEEVGELDVGDIDFVDPTEAAATPLTPMEPPTKTRRAKVS